MPPARPSPLGARSSKLIYALFSLGSHSISALFRSGSHTNAAFGPGGSSHGLAKRTEKFDPHSTKDIVFACLIPILVLLSGLFAGLTLGYMSLDLTQLNVLSMSGTPEQRKYAEKIKPIRKNGHLLLVTLLLANMIVNESLPVIADPVLGGGFQSVVVSTVLIVIFAEIIPQSLFTRHGLYLGAKGAKLTQCLIYLLGVVSWPVAKLLDWILGSNHGIIYRRAELKELIAMHSAISANGGDLNTDTVTIIGATLDLQEKVVRQAMTPIADVFMVEINAKLDYALLKKIVDTGHSRVPVYEEVEVAARIGGAGEMKGGESGEKTLKARKILGILLVKQCVLLDPKDATPLRNLQLNKVPFVPQNESLLGILDRFQEGRSHMAIVSRLSVDKAKSMKTAVKRGLTERLKDRVGMGESSASEGSGSEDDSPGSEHTDPTVIIAGEKGEVHEKDYGAAENGGDEKKRSGRGRFRRRSSKKDEGDDVEKAAVKPTKTGSLQISGREQNMPADAVLAKEGADEFLQGVDPAVMPLGIITLEDVLEELIGEEIYDEFDVEGAHGEPYIHSHATQHHHKGDNNTHGTGAGATLQPPTDPSNLNIVNKNVSGVKGFSFLRSRSAPPRNRNAPGGDPANPNANTNTKGPGSGATTPVTATDVPGGASPRIVAPQPVNAATPMAVNIEGAETSVLSGDITSSPPPSSPPIPASILNLAGTPVSAEGKSNSLPSPSAQAAAAAAGIDPTAPPPLTAILLDRKRRLASSASTATVGGLAGAGGVGGAATPRARSGPRGKFKSGPLVPGGAAAVDSTPPTPTPPAIILEGASTDGQGPEERIPDEKKKIGSDQNAGEEGQE